MDTIRRFIYDECQEQSFKTKLIVFDYTGHVKSVGFVVLEPRQTLSLQRIVFLIALLFKKCKNPLKFQQVGKFYKLLTYCAVFSRILQI